MKSRPIDSRCLAYLVTATAVLAIVFGEEADPYALPEGDSKTLQDFITKLKKMRPKTQQEYLPHRKKSGRAIIDAAARILESEPDEALALEMTSTKLAYLNQLVVYREGNVEAEYADFVETVSKNARPAIANLGHQYQLLVQCEDLKEDGAKFVSRAAEVFGDKIDNSKMSLIFSIGRALGAKKHEKVAADFYRKLGPNVLKSEDANVLRWGKKFEGMARLIELSGKPMEIKGKDLSGEEFDLAKLKGKVVLVDFWATWCGPCIAELPNVKRHYASYHDKGFEVVGISLDTQKAKVEKFIKDNSISWPTLFSEDSNANGWDHPLASYYGIMSIPKAILVNKEGKVVSLNARGTELARLLEESLGEPETDDKEPHEDVTDRNEEGPLAVRSGQHIYFDDGALGKKLESDGVKLLEQGKTATFQTLRQQLDRKSCVLSLATPSTSNKALEILYQECLESLLIVGNIYKCGNCAKWHVDISSSFILSEDGAFVVNYHLFKNEKHHSMVAMTHDGDVLTVKEVLAANESDDLVICRLDSGARKFKPLALSTRSAVGSQVSVISHPSNRFFTLSSGRISRYYFERQKEGSKARRVAITADFGKGSSGGPLINDFGDVVGIVASTNSVYYNSKDGIPRNLQMVFKQCVPTESILALIKPD
ncbi:MAG: redoxin family protein [Planctomycetota bacterium]|nr:redoxin family protein [Planctomycetota bacterium]MDA1137671.1 redoxin family protein [Planctomycetota bacterium]